MSDEIGDIAKACEKISAKYITTKKDLKKAFKVVGVQAGMSVMVHASLKELGYLVNGPHDVIDALLETLTPKGTMLVSANSSQLTDPAEWKAPAVPRKWIPIIRQNMRPFEQKTTLIRGRGLLPITFMMYPGVYRSSHPVKSIAAKGRLAKRMTQSHPFDESEGKGSPIHQLYWQRGFSLLVGVDLTQCSAIHLAEFLADVPYLYPPKFRCCINESGKNHFQFMKKYPITSRYFNKLYRPLKAQGFLKDLRMKKCRVMLLDVYQSVNYVVKLLNQNKSYLLTP